MSSPNATPPPLSFYVHRTSRLSCDLRVYNSDQKTIAYTINTPCGLIDPFAESPNLFIYRGAPHVDEADDNPYENHPSIATATLPKYGTSISLVINDRTIDLPSHTTGLWKYSRTWKSYKGALRWKYGRFGIGMELVDEKGEALGHWESNGGGKWIARLQIKETEEKVDPAWVDEVVSIATAIFVTKTRG